MKITVVDKKSGKSYDLEVYPENTPNDILGVLIEEGYIPQYPGDNPQFFWVLSYRNSQLDPDIPIVNQGVYDGAQIELLPVPVPGR